MSEGLKNEQADESPAGHGHPAADGTGRSPTKESGVLDGSPGVSGRLRTQERTPHREDPPAPIPAQRGFCAEKRRLADVFLEAIKELHALQNEQIHAVIAGDDDFYRFDMLIHTAQQKKDNAKYAWLVHVETHHCDQG